MDMAPGPRPPHACSAPSDPPSAHPTGLTQPWAPQPGGPTAAGARRPGCTGPPRVQHPVSSADGIRDSAASPSGCLLPRLLPERPAGLTPPPRSSLRPTTNAVRRTTSASVFT